MSKNRVFSILNSIYTNPRMSHILNHSLQTAELACNLTRKTKTYHVSQNGNTRMVKHMYPFIVSSLLHDVGRVLEDTDIMDCKSIKHEKAGEIFLKKLGFPKSVTRPIGLHVNAKRYMLKQHSNINCMTDIEMNEFCNEKFFYSAIMLRKLDERAHENIPMNDSLEMFQPFIEEVLD